MIKLALQSFAAKALLCSIGILPAVGCDDAPDPQGTPRVASAGAASAPVSSTSGSASGSRPVSDKTDSPAGAAPASAPAASSDAFEVAPNAELKGRLGRLVIAYPADAPAKDTSAAIFKSGEDKPAQSFYGARTIELLPGKYDLTISGKRLIGLPIESRSDTRVRLGSLRIQADKQTGVAVIDADGQTRLVDGYGAKEYGLPPGEYFIEISGQREKVKVEDGKVTDF